jgi:DNA repair protein RecO (recombination protein O)
MTPPTPGIVLRLHPYSETSLIVRWLTPDHGRIATLARGALRPKSPFRGQLDLFYLGTITFTPSRRSSLHTLSEVTLVDPHPGLRRNHHALEQAAHATRLLERFTETDTPLPELFDLSREFLRHASTHPAHPNLIPAFEVRLLQWSGHAPAPDTLSLAPESRNLWRLLSTCPWSEIVSTSPSPHALQQIRSALRRLLLHLEGP